MQWQRTNGAPFVVPKTVSRDRCFKIFDRMPVIAREIKGISRLKHRVIAIRITKPRMNRIVVRPKISFGTDEERSRRNGIENPRLAGRIEPPTFSTNKTSVKYIGTLGVKMRHGARAAHIEFVGDLTFGDTAMAPARHVFHIEMLAKFWVVFEHQ